MIFPGTSYPSGTLSCRIIGPIRRIGFKPTNRRGGAYAAQIPHRDTRLALVFLPREYGNNYTRPKRDRRATSSLLVLDRRYRRHSSRARI